MVNYCILGVYKETLGIGSLYFIRLRIFSCTNWGDMVCNLQEDPIVGWNKKLFYIMSEIFIFCLDCGSMSECQTERPDGSNHLQIQRRSKKTFPSASL